MLPTGFCWVRWRVADYRGIGINVKEMWSRIMDIIVKTLLAVETLGVSKVSRPIWKNSSLRLGESSQNGLKFSWWNSCWCNCDLTKKKPVPFNSQSDAVDQGLFVWEMGYRLYGLFEAIFWCSSQVLRELIQQKQKFEMLFLKNTTRISRIQV